MRVLCIVGREISYPRNDVLLRAFKRFAQVDVLGSRQPPSSLTSHSLSLIIRALPKLVNGHYDLVFIGFFGHLLMLPVGILSRKPILFDAFVSTYDTLIQDRRLFSPNSIWGRLAFWLDRRACQSAWRVLLDTPMHCKYFADTFNLPISKFAAIPVGCNEDLFYPQNLLRQMLPEYEPVTQVLYYCTYLPLHGVDVVIRAAGLLRSEAISFRLVGEGQEYEQVRRLADELELKTVTFIPSLPLEQIPGQLARADICLGGHFGRSEKTGRVIPGKVFQILATARPLIAGDTPAVRDLLTHERDAYLVPVGDPVALSQAILTLHSDPSLRFRLATEGRKLYETACSEAIITQQLRDICG